MVLSLTEPEPPYSVAHIGGTNFTGRPSTLGVAPLDIMNFSGEDISFIFPQEFSDSDGRNNLVLLAQTITHELAHSLGNRHIDNGDAIMNPIIKLDAKFLDREGAVVDGDGTENSRDILVMNVGNAESGLSDELPKIVDIAMVSEGRSAQLSVFSVANFAANGTAINLSEYDYTWEFNGRTAVGPTIRLFVSNEDFLPIKLSVESDSGEATDFTFEIGRTMR